MDINFTLFTVFLKNDILNENLFPINSQQSETSQNNQVNIITNQSSNLINSETQLTLNNQSLFFMNEENHQNSPTINENII